MQKGKLIKNKNPTSPMKKEKHWKDSRKNTEIVIRQANKAGGIVIQNYQDYNAEAMKILSDENYYTKVKGNPPTASKKQPVIQKT